ncbi:DUF4392 domain-containing protein [Limibacillus halophilus]|uniref:D-glutamate cyclase-like C-terminal domain-containing protein n=1 Tax=Limibacillus halophilus TaxID=1579333 RepID=A0A839SRW8_9PROT|nr:DUF4392 domain-containing protein [Limibacillus halophilus]MBB3063765.1 hypothetical protein [Limibacillus halophilus]
MQTTILDPKRIGDAIDHLVTAPISNWTILKGLPLAKLHAAARELAGGSVTLSAANLLKEKVSRGDRVLVLSGFIMRDYGLPETDGPIGAAVMARALSVGLGAVPIGISEDSIVPCMEACFSAAGLVPATDDQLDSGRHRYGLSGFPVDEAEAVRAAKELLDRHKPKALIAIERPGAGEDGHYHGGGGFEISSFTAKTDILFSEARKAGIPTIGVGDLGNELGMGAVAGIVATDVPLGDVIAARQEADITVVANISNWGAYGIAACLAALVGNSDAFHDGEHEKRLIEACVRAGAIDPVGGQHRLYVDGTDAHANACLVDLLRSIVLLSQREGANISGYQNSWQTK